MIGCKFKGIHSSTLGLVMRSDNRQLLPNSRDEFMEVPQRAGSILFDGKMDDRYLDIEFAFIESSLKDVRLKMREIANWLYSSQLERLYFDDEPDKYYLAKVINRIDFKQQVTIAGSFVVTFRCFPFALSDDRAIQTNITQNNQTFVVQPIGTVPTPPHITVQNVGGTPINGFEIEVEYLNN